MLLSIYLVALLAALCNVEGSPSGLGSSEEWPSESHSPKLLAEILDGVGGLLRKQAENIEQYKACKLQYETRIKAISSCISILMGGLTPEEQHGQGGGYTDLLFQEQGYLDQYQESGAGGAVPSSQEAAYQWGQGQAQQQYYGQEQMGAAQYGAAYPGQGQAYYPSYAGQGGQYQYPSSSGQGYPQQYSTHGLSQQQQYPVVGYGQQQYSAGYGHQQQYQGSTGYPAQYGIGNRGQQEQQPYRNSPY